MSSRQWTEGRGRRLQKGQARAKWERQKADGGSRRLEISALSAGCSPQVSSTHSLVSASAERDGFQASRPKLCEFAALIGWPTHSSPSPKLETPARP